MASHFGTIQFVDVGTWAYAKTIKAETGSSKYKYCEHETHYSIIFTLEGLHYQFIMNRDGGSDETDWNTNFKSGALRVG